MSIACRRSRDPASPAGASTGRRWRAGAPLLAAGLLLLAAPLHPQQPPSAEKRGGAPGAPVPAAVRGTARFASPFLPPGHWTRDALRRLSGLALLPARHDPSVSAVTRRAAAEALAEARARSAGGRAASLTEAYWERFAEEFPHTASAVAGDARRAGVFVGNSASVGFEALRDGLLPRHRAAVDLPERTEPLGDLDDVGGRLQTGVQLHPVLPALAGYAAVRRAGGEWSLTEGYGTLAAAGMGIWAGRRRLGYGPGRGGGLVLTAGVPHDGAGLYLTDGLRLPAFLRHLGVWHFEASIARPDHAGGIESPWLMTGRLSVAPHRRVRLGINRGVYFGGRNNSVETTVGRVLEVIGGFNTKEPGQPGNFENQVASVDVWVVPPLGPVPLVVYGEWAIEDVSASRFEMPGLLAGARLAGIPGIPGAHVGVEWVSFPDSAEGHGPWYEHRTFGTWTGDGRLLAHPLGGEGREWRVYGGLDLWAARLRLQGDAFLRDREPNNLFAPDRLGDARGVSGAVEFRLQRHLQLLVRGRTEAAEDGSWRETRGFAGLEALF